MKILVLALVLIPTAGFTVGELYCDQVASEKTAFGYSVCGVGTAQTEEDARKKSRKSADEEFKQKFPIGRQ